MINAEMLQDRLKICIVEETLEACDTYGKHTKVLIKYNKLASVYFSKDII